MQFIFLMLVAVLGLMLLLPNAKNITPSEVFDRAVAKVESHVQQKDVKHLETDKAKAQSRLSIKGESSNDNSISAENYHVDTAPKSSPGMNQVKDKYIQNETVPDLPASAVLRNAEPTTISRHAEAIPIGGVRNAISTHDSHTLDEALIGTRSAIETLDRIEKRFMN
jgi:hypothetical protein